MKSKINRMLDNLVKVVGERVAWEYNLRVEYRGPGGWKEEFLPFSELLIPYREELLLAYRNSELFRNPKIVRRMVGVWEELPEDDK